MLSTGLSKTVGVAPPAALVTFENVPVRRLPRTSVSVYVSRTLRVAGFTEVIGPLLIRGILVCFVPTVRAVALDVLVKRN